MINIRCLATHSPKYGEYKYVSITLPDSLRKAARLRKEDRLSFTVQDNQVRISYNPDGKQYLSGIIGINEKHFVDDLNLSFAQDVEYTVEGNELVISVPDDAFIIERGFNVISQDKGFDQIDFDSMVYN